MFERLKMWIGFVAITVVVVGLVGGYFFDSYIKHNIEVPTTTSNSNVTSKSTETSIKSGRVTAGAELTTTSLSYVAPTEQAFKTGKKILASYNTESIRRYLSSGEVLPINEGTSVLVLDTKYFDGWALVKITSGSHSGQKGYIPSEHLK